VRLLRVAAANFRSFAELDLDLNADGLIAVVGANGAGKSTIFAAVEWALYGGPRGRGALPARRDAAADGELCWVEVEFEVAGRAYSVRRVDGRDARLVELASQRTIATTLTETSRQVAALLGLTRDMFRGTFYARQKEVHALDGNDEHKRREQVELLLGIERLRRATGYAAAEAKEQKVVVDTLAAQTPDLTTRSAELDHAQNEAQCAHPAVQQATEKLDALKSERQQAKQQLEALRAQERLMLARRHEAQQAALVLAGERAAAERLVGQLAEAQAAESELATLAPLSAQVEELAAREREFDLLRANHERANAWRARHEQALRTTAELTDRIRALARQHEPIEESDPQEEPDPAGLEASIDRLHEQIEATEQELTELRPQRLAADDAVQAAQRRADQLALAMTQATRAGKIRAELVQYSDIERAVDAAVAEWHERQARRRQLQEAIEHDTQHREAVLAGTEQAACPMCKRKFGQGELEQVLAIFECDLAAAQDELATIDSHLPALEAQGKTLRERARRAQALTAELAALDTTDELTALEAELSDAGQQLTVAESERQRLGEQIDERARRLPALREHARRMELARREHAQVAAQLSAAQHDVAVYAEQLATVNVNGYDGAAHLRLRDELERAQAAVQRCAVLRTAAEALGLLGRRLAEQELKVSQTHERSERLASAVAEVAVGDDAVPRAEARCEQAEQAVEDAHEALRAAERRASADSDAVAAAQARLADAREQHAALAEQRRELRLRQEVAAALSAYREEASRRARPTLERETSLLLGQVTRGRYSTVGLTDSYLLQIVDGRAAHALRRFSGGEQDLAGLCLRLALSRALARQRGAETGFVILDEVFGSQDADRRRALLEQLGEFVQSEFRQLFVVSHTDDALAHCSLHIDVVRNDDGVSVAVGPHT
jgi:exonuclease SbcC